MIECQLKPSGVISPHVSAAFFTVARERFIAPDRRGLAYIDAAHPLAAGRELMQPLSLGLLIEAARIAADDHVLIVGAGSGYSAAVIAPLAATVVALESDADLAAQAEDNLSSADNVRVVQGSLTEGWAESAPYDLVLIDGAIEFLPPALGEQLKDGGRLLCVLRGADGVSRAARGIRHGGQLSLESFTESHAALLPGFDKPKGFRF